MELLYKVKDRPSVGKILIFALQQFLSIVAGTVTMPLIVGGLSQSAALFGAAIGTLVYLLITRFKSPVFLGSSFSFLGSMSAAFAGASTAAIGYVGVIIGAILAGLVYVILSIIIHFTGRAWIERIMPPIIVGPVVIIIALSLAPQAVNNLTSGNVIVDGVATANPYLCLLCGFIAFVVVVICSVYGKKMIKLIPFIIGILAGYAVALIFTLIGNATGVKELMIINFDAFNDIKWVPDFAFTHIADGISDLKDSGDFLPYLGLIAASYVPVALAVFAEHIADHKNISQIIETDLLEDPGLDKTLMGDGLGSMVGAICGACPNTTYGESISCIAFSKNASIITIVVTSLMALAFSFLGPVMAFFATIPNCIVGGISIALYGLIALSGFNMLFKVDVKKQKNLFVVVVILVFGIGGLVIQIEHVVFPSVAVAFVAGLFIYSLINIGERKKAKKLKENEDNNGTK